MFHLFNKVYLSFDFALEFGNRIIITDRFEDVFFDEDEHQQFIAPTYDELINRHFDGVEDNLWAFLTNIPNDNKFVLYVDEKEFFPIMLKYLRSIFPAATDSTLYVLYRLTMLRFKIIHSQRHYIGRVQADLFANLELMTKAKFTKMAKTIDKIAPLSEEARQTVSLEFLLPSYLLDTDTVYDKTFEERASRMLWKSIAWELSEFKRNGIAGFFDLDELYDDIGELKYETASFKNVLKAHPELDFLQDMDIQAGNLDYIKNCDISAMFKFNRDQQEFIGVTGDDTFLYILEKFANAEDNSAIIRELIELDMDTNYGTQLFARSDYGEKMNPFIISYFYDLARKKKQTELKKFAL